VKKKSERLESLTSCKLRDPTAHRNGIGRVLGCPDDEFGPEDDGEEVYEFMDNLRYGEM
jgi:hypothetical protein